MVNEINRASNFINSKVLFSSKKTRIECDEEARSLLKVIKEVLSDIIERKREHEILIKGLKKQLAQLRQDYKEVYIPYKKERQANHAMPDILKLKEQRKALNEEHNNFLRQWHQWGKKQEEASKK